MNRELSFSSRRLLETAYLCALNNHSQYITPEHILAALFQGNEFLSVTECLGETGNNICNILNMFISSLASHILNSEVPEVRMSLIDYISNAIEYL